MRPGLRRTLVVGVLVVTLTGTVGATNLVVGAHRTVLDSDFVTTSLSEEDAYTALRETARQQVGTEPASRNESTPESSASRNESTPESSASRNESTPEFSRTLTVAVLDPTYVESQVEPNVERTYAYLHGDTDELVLLVDLTPAKRNVVEAAKSEVHNRSGVDVLVGFFGAENATFSARELTVTVPMLRSMEANETGYRDTRAAVRTAVRETVIASMVDRAYRNGTDDERLALVIADYDPDAYTKAEKRDLVAARETEIRTVFRQRIVDENATTVANRTRRELTEARAAMVNRVADEDALGTDDDATTDAVRRLRLAYVDGLTTDQKYASFEAEVAGAKREIAAAVGHAFERRLDENLDDELVVSDHLEPSARSGVASARDVVVVLDAAGVVLPLFVLVELALLWHVTCSPAITIGGFGFALFATGSSTFLAIACGRDHLSAFVQNASIPQIALVDAALGVLDRVFDTFTGQSLVIAGLGTVLLGIAVVHYAKRR